MQLKIQRSQRASGVMSKSVMFCVDARVHLTPEEQSNVQKYRLGGQLIYSSQNARKHSESAVAHSQLTQVGGGPLGIAIASAGGHAAKTVFHAIAHGLSLNITVDSLQRGQHIECKDLDEVLEAEDALDKACQGLRVYLETAATFDGREVVIDYSKAEPEVVSSPAFSPPVAPAIPGPAPVALSAPLEIAGVVADPEPAPAFSPAMSFPTSSGAAANVVSPGAEFFKDATTWWNGLTREQRRMILIVTGVVLLILLFKFG